MNKIYLIILLFAMKFPSYSQARPSADKVSTSAGTVEMNFIGHGSLMFTIGSYVIHIDPVRSSGNYVDLPKADLILVTHEHYDHLDTDLIKELSKQGTVILCNEASSSKVAQSFVLKPGEIKKLASVTIEAVAAYNILHERSKDQPFHPKGTGNGYILTIGDKRFYIAGDTENTPEMKGLKDIYVAFLPMNLPYTMTPEMVADAAKAFRPEILYPYHYGETDTGELERLLKDAGIEVRIRNLK